MSNPMDHINKLIAMQTADIRAERDAALARERALREVLSQAEALRPRMLKDGGYVPEYVLDFCNKARAALKVEA